MKKQYIQLEPSLFGGDMGRISDEAIACKAAGSEILHLDVMDGLFVRNLTMGPAIVASVRKAVPKLILDVHLMIYHPENFIEAFMKAGADEITFHLEATEDIEHTAKYIRKGGRKAGLAINPETSENLCLKYLDQFDKILIMTVNPGFGGQAFIPEMLDKVRFLREVATQQNLKLDIQVDGGIDLEIARECILAGANRIVIGTQFFKAKDRGAFVAEFNKLRGATSHP